MNANHILALGMTRALGVMEDSGGDLDFAIIVVKKDIEALKQAGDELEASEKETGG